jgi:hypothetical protein
LQALVAALELLRRKLSLMRELLSFSPHVTAKLWISSPKAFDHEEGGPWQCRPMLAMMLLSRILSSKR